MLAFGATLSGMLMLVQQSPVIVATGPHSVGTRYHLTDYESACGPAVFRVRFRNGPEEDGRVEHVLIDGRPVRDAAEILDIRAARRFIDSIEIMNCGKDRRHPAFRGAMKLSKAASQVASLRDTLFFRLSREGSGDWRLTIDD